MNVVVFSYNFFPQADPESYCSTRFVSALARAGHNVTLVSMDWPKQVSDKTYDALVHPGIKIVRVPFSGRRNSPLKGLLWYGHKDQMAVDVKNCAKVVKQILKQTPHPVLVTRSMPIASAMVGLRVRRYAQLWIAHFSDPVPWGNYADTIGHKILKCLELNIVKDTFKEADAISVTSYHVSKYFKEVYGSAYDRNKVVWLSHIGDYRLGEALNPSKSKDNTYSLVHPGQIYHNRGGEIICKVMEEFSRENFPCKFVQVGSVDNSIKDRLQAIKNIKINDSLSFEGVLQCCREAQAIFVPDFESSLGYSPVMLSKFVYQIMDNIPIVVYSYKESDMHDIAMQYPEAGIFFAEIGNVESLKEAIKTALNCDVKGINRTAVRELFSERTIVTNFEKKVKELENISCK